MSIKCQSPCGSVIFTLIPVVGWVPAFNSCVNRHQCWFLRTRTRHSLSLGLQRPAWCPHKMGNCAGSMCWVDFNGMMFLLLGLGLTQYFSEALTWFWESSLLIKYSGECLFRDLLIYVFKLHVPLPTELAFLAVTRAFLCPLIMPSDSVEAFAVTRILWGLAFFLTCSLISVIHFTSWSPHFPLC